MKLETVKSMAAIAVLVMGFMAMVTGCARECFVKPATVLAVIQK